MVAGDGRPVVFITGCSEGGIGYALAREFAAEGCFVVATSRSTASMEALRGRSSFLLLELDVSSEESVRAAVEAAMSAAGRIDILVNNAGTHLVAPIAESPMPSVRQVFDTNLYGPLRVIQEVVPHMIERRKGTIVNVGSISVLAPGPWIGVYSASKAALHALTNSLRLELMTFDIKVVNVVPGAIRSNLGRSSASKYGEMPEWRFYGAFDGVIRARTTLSQDVRPTPAEELARKAVPVLLKAAPPPWFTYGRFSTVFAILFYLPNIVTVWFFRFLAKSC